MKYDKEFLKQLDKQRTKEIYVRIQALNYAEQPIEMIEGLATGGSINIDGASALRRSCSLTLVAKELNINDFYWGVKNKFKLEVGLKNTVDLNKYPEIIWFDQGIYLISTFNTSYTTNNYTISISGKDKMAMLNGEMGGHLTASVDFGVEEYYDLEKGQTIYIDIPLKKAIEEMLHTWAGEDYHNIVINDLDIQGYELLEYIGDTPLFLTYSNKNQFFDNVYLDKETKCIYDSHTVTFGSLLEDSSFIWNPMLEIGNEISNEDPSIIQFADVDDTYTLAKVEYGQAAGYRLTDLTYAGDLIGKAGETVTSVLDKIVKMLGNYEYFYDVNGQFVFQKKQTYTHDVPNNIITDPDEGIYVTPMLNTSVIEYNFTNTELITSFSNNPNLLNVKNDLSVWGSKKSGSSSADIPIHYRYAIDRKPTGYNSITVTEEDVNNYNKTNTDIKMKEQDGQKYKAEPDGQYNWRELIYQMAQDYYKYNRLPDFGQKVQEANPQFLNGKTGYEQYYVDIQGFWRDIYDPSNPSYMIDYTNSNITEDRTGERFETTEDLFLTSYFSKIANITENTYNLDPSLVYSIDERNGVSEIVPVLDIFPTGFSESFENQNADGTKVSSKYYLPKGKDDQGKVKYEPITELEKPYVEKKELYIKDENKENNFISYYTYILNTYVNSNNSGQDSITLYEYKENPDPIKVSDLEDEIRLIIREEVSLEGEPVVRYRYQRYLYQHYVDMDNNLILNSDNEPISPKMITINYKQECHDFDAKNYWNKQILKEPTLLTYWLDFLDVDSELGQYAVPQIGMRTKVVNDNNIKAIYYRNVPDVVFAFNNEEVSSAYIKVQMQPEMESLFNISGQGKSAKDVIDELIYQHSYCIENVTIATVPIYYLNPNTRIYVFDEKSKINGEYIMTKFSIPLTYNGTMSITANKAPKRRII